MRSIKTVLLAAGAVALAGTAALAANTTVHHMTVRLPGGGVEEIEYTGDVAPKVSVQPTGPVAFGPQMGFAPFANFAQIQAQMDAQMRGMQAMMNQANAAMAAAAKNPNAPLGASFGGMPGGNNFSFVSNGGGGNFCAQSVQVTVVNGKQHVERHQSGNCGPAQGKVAAPQEHAPPAHRGDSI